MGGGGRRESQCTLTIPEQKKQLGQTDIIPERREHLFPPYMYICIQSSRLLYFCSGQIERVEWNVWGVPWRVSSSAVSFMRVSLLASIMSVCGECGECGKCFLKY